MVHVAVQNRLKIIKLYVPMFKLYRNIILFQMGPMLRFQRIYGLKNTYSVVTTAISRGTIHQKSTCDFNQSSSRGFHGYCGSENFCQSGFRSGSCRGITTSAVVRNKKVFDRKAKLMQKERAALLDDVDSYDYIKSQVGYKN